MRGSAGSMATSLPSQSVLTSSSRHRGEQRDLLPGGEGAGSLDVDALDYGDGRGQGGAEIGRAAGEAVVEVLHGRVARKLDPEHGSRRESRQTAAKANPNDHAPRIDLTSSTG